MVFRSGNSVLAVDIAGEMFFVVLRLWNTIAMVITGLAIPYCLVLALVMGFWMIHRFVKGNIKHWMEVVAFLVAIPISLVVLSWLTFVLIDQSDIADRMVALKLEYFPDVGVDISALDQISALSMGILAVLLSFYKALPKRLRARSLWSRGLSHGGDV
jgi:uncharacterized iron-regulated membrane protein